MNPWTQVLQVVGPLGGVVVGGLLTFLQQRTAWGREREARREEIESRRTQRWKDFQIQTLVDLQDAMLELQVVTWRIRNANTYPVPKNLNEEYDAAETRTCALVVRVQDERIRDLVAEFEAYADRAISDANSEPDATNMNDAIHHANTRIGEVLRSLY